MNFDDYAEMFLYFNTILPPAAVRLNRVTILGLTPSIGCRAIQLHGFVSIITTRYNRAVNDNYNGMPEAAQAKAMTRAAIDGNLTELNLGGIQQTASELALYSWVQGFKPNDDYEKMQFYYHPDHLGSSSYITNLDGEVSQHIEYVPFGEVFIEERNNTWNTPYLFNAKELDEETGMYYYGARYYEPRLSLWMTVDPMEENLPSSSTYSYAANNPIRFIDMEGKIPFDKSVAHTRISSGFGIRKHPITGELKGHGGIDLATAGTGHDVHVLADGVVKKVGWNVKVDSKGNKTGYGRYVIVQHSDGYETLYAHLDKNGVAVSVGDKVSENDVIAKSGNTGGSTGPHLHIEISKGNILQKSNKIDPSSIPDLQLLLHPDNKEYYGGELSPVTVYGHAPTPMLLQPISLPKIEEIKINTQDKE